MARLKITRKQLTSRTHARSVIAGSRGKLLPRFAAALILVVSAAAVWLLAATAGRAVPYAER